MPSPSSRITLRPLSTEVRPEQVLELSPATIYVCDCCLAGAEGALFWADLDEVTDGEFFPALLPEATLILVACPMPDGQPGKQVKLRLGLAAPACFSLDDLGLRQLDPNYGGRWNAGSNKRGGGTTASIQRYARDVARLLRDALGRRPASTAK